MKSAQKSDVCSLNFSPYKHIVEFFSPRASDHDNLTVCGKEGTVSPEHFANESLSTISTNGVSYSFCDGNTKSIAIFSS